MSVLSIPDLEAAYLLDETSGTTAVDSSGNGNDGDYDRDASNTHETVSGLGAITDSQLLNGTSDRVTTPVSLSFGASFTVAGYFRLDDFSASGAGFSTCFFGSDSTTFRPLMVDTNQTTLGLAAGGFTNGTNAVRFAAPGAALDGSWHHLAMAWDFTGGTAGVARFYVDGLLVDTASLTTINPASFVLWLGDGNSGGQELNGAAASCYLFSRDLESYEIAQLYAEGGTPQLDVGRVGHFKLEETAGTTVADSSPAGNDGTASEDMSGLTAPGVSGRGVLMDGTQHILAPYATGFGSYPFSMGCAFKHDGTAVARAIMAIADASEFNVYWQLQVTNTGALYVVRRNTTQVSDDTGASPDTSWHTVLAVFPDATSAIVYLDGVEIYNESALTSVAAAAGADTMLIGDFRTTDATGQFIGSLDEASFWTRALSAAEAAEWHQFTIFPLAARHSAEPLGLETSLSL